MINNNRVHNNNNSNNNNNNEKWMDVRVLNNEIIIWYTSAFMFSKYRK